MSNQESPSENDFSDTLLRGLSLILPFIFIIFGCVISLFIHNELSLGIFTQWNSLGVPPEKATKIFAADYKSIYIRSLSGEIYENSTFENTIYSFSKGQWKTTVNVDVDDNYTCDRQSSYAPKPPPGTIDYFQIGYCPMDTTKGVHYAVIDDGSVMVWATPNLRIDNVQAIGLGSIVGLFIGIILTIRFRDSINHPDYKAS